MSLNSNLQLYPITENDTDLIVKWRNNINVKKNFIFQEQFTREIHLNWLKTNVFTEKALQFIINYNGISIGSTFLRDIDYSNNKAEFGIFIGEDEYRGKGLGTQATLQILRYGFEELNLNKIFLRVLNNNTYAVNSYMKSGFQEEGLFKEDVYIKDKYYDVLFMSILKKEWIKVND